MTKENFTSINVIIDASGSMQSLTKDTIGSFNSFLTEQKAVPGEAVFTLCTFNTDYKLVHDFVALTEVPDLDPKSYRPNGCTALLDAMGVTINSVGQKLAAMPENDRPSKVIFLIITDGEENSSQKFTLEQVQSMVEHQRSKYSWEFVFIGANIDAIATGSSLGISAANSLNYDSTAVGTRGVYKSASSNLRSYRLQASKQVDFFNQNPVSVPASPSTPATTTTTTTTTTVVPPVVKK